MITLKQLEAFYWTAELASVERASLRLNTTQSAISKRLQELELDLDTLLFDRSRRPAKLTTVGEDLLVTAKEMLDLRNRILDRNTLPGLASRQLRLGVTELTAVTWLPRMINRIRAAYPQVIIEPTVNTSTHLVEQLNASQLDIVIAPDAFDNSDCVVTPLDFVEYAWMCSPQYLNVGKAIPIHEFENYTVIVQENASGLGNLIGRWLTDNKTNVKRSITSSNLTVLASLVLSGIGITYLPHRIFEHAVDSGQLLIIESIPPIPKIPYVALSKKEQQDEFLRFAISIASEACNFSLRPPAYVG